MNKRNVYFQIVIQILIMMGVLGVSAVAMIEDSLYGRWSQEKAWKWYNQHPWPVGCNFNPSTAINQLEMWQQESFDPETIDRELGWARDLGMNVVRVYLHDMLWKQNSEDFLKRVDCFLSIADKHKIKVMFVPLDSVWNPCPSLGQQPEPTPMSTIPDGFNRLISNF